MSLPAMARQPTATDVVNFPDVGRMTRQDFHQLESSLYGRQPTSEGAPSRSAASTAPAPTPSPNARSTPELRSLSELRGGIEHRGNALGRRRFAPDYALPELQSTSGDASSPSGSPSAVDLMAGRMSEHDLLQMMGIGGPARNAASRLRLSSSSRPHGLSSAADASISAASSSHAHEQTSVPGPIEPQNEMVHIPDVGRMSRRDLERLEAVLNGSTQSSTDLSELPDLSGMDANQLARIEAALSGSSVSPAGDSAANARDGHAAGAVNGTAPQARRGNPALAFRGEQARRGSGTGASDAEDRSASGGVSFMSAADRALGQNSTPIPGRGQKRWNVKDEALEKLSVSVQSLPLGQECAICCQSLDIAAVALPCTKQNCTSFFHSSCIRPWLEQNPSCPLCRCSLEDLVSPRARRCQGCGGSAASVEALLTAMALAELIGQRRAMTWLLQQSLTAPNSGDAAPPIDLTTLTSSSNSSNDGIDNPTALLMEALLQDSWALTSDVTPAENARARLEGSDLAQVLGDSPAVGQWQTAAELLGLPSQPDASGVNVDLSELELRNAQAEASQRRLPDAEGWQRNSPASEQQRSSSAARGSHARRSAPREPTEALSRHLNMEAPTYRSRVPALSASSQELGAAARLEHESFERNMRSDQMSAGRSMAPQRRENHALMPPPGRWILNSSQTPQASMSITQRVLQRPRPADAVLRLPSTAVSTETGLPSNQVPRNRHTAVPSGGGWRPPSRGSARPQAQSLTATSFRSTSMPQLGRAAAASSQRF